ncbi:MAG TPA: 1-phosphofructokinase, partial [Actinomycetota bacterium]
LAEALAWGAGAASLPGSRMPTPDDLDRDAVTIADRIDPDRPLKERS